MSNVLNFMATQLSTISFMGLVPSEFFLKKLFPTTSRENVLLNCIIEAFLLLLCTFVSIIYPRLAFLLWPKVVVDLHSFSPYGYLIDLSSLNKNTILPSLFFMCQHQMSMHKWLCFWGFDFFSVLILYYQLQLL